MYIYIHKEEINICALEIEQKCNPGCSKAVSLVDSECKAEICELSPPQYGVKVPWVAEPWFQASSVNLNGVGNSCQKKSCK